MSEGPSKHVIYAALIGNLMIAVVKFAAATWTGSSAMLSEGVHSIVDTGNQALMLYGVHRAAQPPDEDHPLGHGRELYFWSFIVALLIFSLGAGISFYEGVSHILAPVPITDPFVNYVVLGIAFIFEGISWFVAWQEFSRRRGDLGIIEAAVKSRDPTSFVVLFEDSAALVGIVIAAAGTFAAEILDMPEFDGIASIGISLVLAGTAVFLARESKGLLIGEQARIATRRSILCIARDHSGVTGVGQLITVHLAPDQIVAGLNIDFDNQLHASDVETIVNSLETKIRKSHPDVIVLFIKPHSGLNASHT